MERVNDTSAADDGVALCSVTAPEVGGFDGSGVGRSVTKSASSTASIASFCATGFGFRLASTPAADGRASFFGSELERGAGAAPVAAVVVDIRDTPGGCIGESTSASSDEGAITGSTC